MSDPRNHPCLICERWGCFGFAWPERMGAVFKKVTHWYCDEHAEIGRAALRQSKGLT